MRVGREIGTGYEAMYVCCTHSYIPWSLGQPNSASDKGGSACANKRHINYEHPNKVHMWDMSYVNNVAFKTNDFCLLW